MHAASACPNVISTNDTWPYTPAMQSSLEVDVRRLHSPDTVQHCAAILVPSGVAVAVGDVMQTPLETASASPLRTRTLLNGGGLRLGGGGDGGGGGGDCGGGE